MREQGCFSHLQVLGAATEEMDTLEIWTVTDKSRHMDTHRESPYTLMSSSENIIDLHIAQNICIP